MSNCKNICRLCERLIISNSVTVITVDGVDTLVIDIPLQTYRNCEKYCIVVAQAIPTTATITMPVAISIGGDTTTVYPITLCNCNQINACAIRTRTKYSTKVYTSATSGTFRLLGNVNCYPQSNLPSLPVPDTIAVASTFSNRNVGNSTMTTTTTTRTTTKKEVIANE